MSSEGDSLKIPIEIKTDDLDEIRELINEIATAESDLHTLKPRKGKGSGDTSSRSAFANPPENLFGAFGQLGENKPSNTQGKDKTSKQPFQRESEFKKLKERVEQNESSTAKIFTGIGQAIGIKSFGSANAFKDGTAATKFASIAGVGNQGILAGATLARGGLGGVVGRITGIAGKAFLPVAAIMTIISTVELIVSEFFKPGGELDRRYRRVIRDEISGSVEQTKKQAIKQGSMVVRVETIAGVRGERGLNSNLSNLISNNSVYLNDLHQKSRGLKP